MAALILFDDATARGWKPFTWTRPAGELVFGGYSFRERAEAVFGVDCLGLVSPGLEGFDEPGSPPVIDPTAVDSTTARFYLSSRFAPAWGAPPTPPDGEALIEVDGQIAGWYVPAGAGPTAAFFEDPATAESSRLPRLSIDGHVVSEFWDLVTGHGERLRTDMLHAVAASQGTQSKTPHVIGDRSALRIDDDVSIEPGVVIDCTGGPVWLERGVHIRAFTRLEGPARIGSGTTLLGGSLETVTIGAACKVRGELESTILLACSNKAHDGFIGHAYIGRWVNLGALTTNSDLKNNYGPVRLTTRDGSVDTGEMKVGCFIGDHVKTAIGTRLNTGTVVGPGSNIFGDATPPGYVLPFSWGGGPGTMHSLDRFLATAEVVMRRRNVSLTPGVRSILERAWHASRGSRE